MKRKQKSQQTGDVVKVIDKAYRMDQYTKHKNIQYQAVVSTKNESVTIWLDYYQYIHYLRVLNSQINQFEMKESRNIFKNIQRLKMQEQDIQNQTIDEHQPSIEDKFQKNTTEDIEQYNIHNQTQEIETRQKNINKAQENQLKKFIKVSINSNNFQEAHIKEQKNTILHENSNNKESSQNNLTSQESQITNSQQSQQISRQHIEEPIFDMTQQDYIVIAWDYQINFNQDQFNLNSDNLIQNLQSQTKQNLDKSFQNSFINSQDNGSTNTNNNVSSFQLNLIDSDNKLQNEQTQEKEGNQDEQLQIVQQSQSENNKSFNESKSNSEISKLFENNQRSLTNSNDEYELVISLQESLQTSQQVIQEQFNEEKKYKEKLDRFNEENKNKIQLENLREQEAIIEEERVEKQSNIQVVQQIEESQIEEEKQNTQQNSNENLRQIEEERQINANFEELKKKNESQQLNKPTDNLEDIQNNGILEEQNLHNQQQEITILSDKEDQNQDEQRQAMYKDQEKNNIQNIYLNNQKNQEYGCFALHKADSIFKHKLSSKKESKVQKYSDISLSNVKYFDYKVTWRPKKSGRVPKSSYYTYNEIKTSAPKLLLNYFEKMGLLKI